MVNAPLRLDTSYRRHVVVAAFIAIWLVLFLVLIAPFDVADLPLKIRLIILPPYGLITFVGYLMLVPLQNKVFKYFKKWTLVFEVLFLCCFNFLVFFGSFLYYKTDIVNGTFPFSKFLLEVYLPIFFILLIVIVFARWYLNKKGNRRPIKKITLIGDNKNDILILNPNDLVAISSADNYVEISYLSNGALKRKLLRSTLKKIETEVELQRVHRSHLINLVHFKEWKNANVIIVNTLEIPVSKNYKDALSELKNHP